MRRFRPGALVAACACALLTAAPATAAPQTPDQAFAELNAWRAQANVPALTTLDPAWNAACAAHVNYMRLNGGVTHVEIAGAPGYSDAGYQAGIHSVLFQSSDTAAGPRTFEQGVYHRMALLEPRLRTTGWDSEAGFACMFKDGLDNAATAPGLVAYPWPADGMTGVPTAMAGAESPDPHADSGTSGTLGYLLSVNWNGPWLAPYDGQTDVTSASLTRDGGGSVDVAVSDKDAPNGWAVRPGFALIPKAPLADAAWYTATASGTVSWTGGALPFSVSWRFGTGRAAVPSSNGGTIGGSGGGGSGGGGSGGGGAGAGSTPVGSAPARLVGARVQRARGRLVVTGKVRPASRGLRLTIRATKGRHARRTRVRERANGRFRAVLRAPRGSGRLRVTVTVPAAAGRHGRAVFRF